jgi:hypothetical protein
MPPVMPGRMEEGGFTVSQTGHGRVPLQVVCDGMSCASMCPHGKCCCRSALPVSQGL